MGLLGRRNIRALAKLAGKGIIPSPLLSARYVLRKYIRDPEYFWHRSHVRQAIKVLNVRRPFSRAGFYSPAEVADCCIAKVGKLRDAKYNKPIFIIGPGGCGSHWLGQILGDLPQFYHGKEIYVPRSLLLLYDLLGNIEMANLIWACMVLNTWGLTGPKETFMGDMVISNRPNTSVYYRYREIWPQSRWIWLIRDPRDQVLSITHRKQRFRAFTAPDMSDDQYLERNCRSAVAYFRVYQSIQEHVCLMKYEDLRVDTFSALHPILVGRFGFEVEENELAEAIAQNDVNAMRKGVIPKRGNLDEGGVARGWRESMTEHERAICKPIVEEVVEHFGYDRRVDW